MTTWVVADSVARHRAASRLLDLAERVDKQRAAVSQAAHGGFLRGFELEQLTILGAALSDAERLFARAFCPGHTVHAIDGVVVAAQRTGDCKVVFECTREQVQA